MNDDTTTKRIVVIIINIDINIDSFNNDYFGSVININIRISNLHYMVSHVF